ncbi:MAG: ATP-binding protein [Piscinibacter sp.]|uniref:hybrid sensor histidine kinase/response regulator n=1 Tax=Piscinibacter sp. TaxID=1903157 RepID=UPI003D0DF38D
MATESEPGGLAAGWWRRLLQQLRPSGQGAAQSFESLQRHLAAAREQADRLQAVLDQASDAVISVDAEQRVHFFNKAAAAVFGVGADEAIGEPLDRFIPTERQLAHRLHVESYRRTGSTARRMGRLHELAGQRADGEVFPIEASISRSGEGDDMLMTVVLRDVSDLRSAEAARQAQLRAEASRQAMSEFVARMSHEMRTPLNAVLGFSQLLQSDEHEPLAPGQAQRVEQIRAAGWHLLRLIADASDLSIVEAGALRLEVSRVSLDAVIDEALAICETQARARGIRVHRHDRDGAVLHVDGDALRIRQALINVLSNAVKYNRDGGAIDIRAARDGDSVRVEVGDTGLGMTREQLAHLYEPFNRLGRERDVAEGTGIGLVLTRQLVERMNGRLEIDSEAGQGTRVRITLPAAARAEDAAPAIPPPPPPAGAPAALDLPPLVLLYVEDNPVNVLLVQQLLARWPQIELVHAEDGQAGLELARRMHPDLVLLDMHLPDMEGSEVLEELKRNPDTAALGVVVLSASEHPQDAHRAREAGALEYWTKPLDLRSFPADVIRVIGREAAAR